MINPQSLLLALAVAILAHPPQRSLSASGAGLLVGGRLLSTSADAAGVDAFFGKPFRTGDTTRRIAGGKPYGFEYRCYRRSGLAEVRAYFYKDWRGEEHVEFPGGTEPTPGRLDSVEFVPLARTKGWKASLAAARIPSKGLVMGPEVKGRSTLSGVAGLPSGTTLEWRASRLDGAGKPVLALDNHYRSH